MFKEELNYIIKESFGILNLSGPYVKFSNIVNSGIHPALKTYISAELDFLVYKDRVRLLSKSQFDYSGPVINELFTKIGDELKENKKLSIEYVKKIIKFAAAFNMHYLTKPNETLRKFLFFEDKHKPIEEILTLLNYVYFYPYLRESLELYFQRKRLISINGEELTSILNKIDETVSDSERVTIVNSAIDSLQEILSSGNEQNESLKIEFINSFLNDKGYTNYKNLINQKISDDQTEIEITELKEIFGKIESESKEAELPDDHPSMLPIEEEDITHGKDLFDSLESAPAEEVQNDPDKMWEEITEQQQTESPDQVLEEISGEGDLETESVLEEETEDAMDDDSEIETEEKIIEEENQTDIDEPEEEESETIEVELGRTKSELSDDDFIEDDLESDLELLSEEKLQDEEEIRESEETVDEDDSEDTDLEKEEADEFQSSIDENLEDENLEDEKNEQIPVHQIEVSKLLENKQMPKIIEVVFDYDMEDFSNLLDGISFCSTAEEVEKTIDKHMENIHVDTSLKEVETLKSIIIEQFEQ